jgi:hypothetical protein
MCQALAPPAHRREQTLQFLVMPPIELLNHEGHEGHEVHKAAQPQQTPAVEGKIEATYFGPFVSFVSFVVQLRLRRLIASRGVPDLTNLSAREGPWVARFCTPKPPFPAAIAAVQ